MTNNPEALLTADTVLPYLRERGLVEGGATVRQLGGGISNVVFAVESTSAIVVKQSLPRLRVEASWEAPQERILTEADALTLCAGLTPARAPRLLDVDPDRFVLCIERAPSDWRDWKSCLMDRSVQAGAAYELGWTLARWHSATLGGQGTTPRMTDPSAFEMLRVDPYFRTLVAKWPYLTTEIESVVEELLSRRDCLVHGDFSPKNVLVGPRSGDVLVIDFEVAHLGDPAFDVAFLLSHLTLKSLHLPEIAPHLDEASRRFIEAYSDRVPEQLRPNTGLILRYLGALLLARVHGKSPAEYLDQAGRQHAVALGTALLRHEVDSLQSLTHLRQKALR